MPLLFLPLSQGAPEPWPGPIAPPFCPHSEVHSLVLRMALGLIWLGPGTVAQALPQSSRLESFPGPHLEACRTESGPTFDLRP